MNSRSSKKDFKRLVSKQKILTEQFKLPDNFNNKVLYLEEILNCGKFTIDLLHELVHLYTVTYSK